MFDAGGLAEAVEAVGSALDRLTALPAGALDGAPTSVLLTAAADLEHAQTLVSLAQARVLAALDVVAPLTYTPGPRDPAPLLPTPEQTTAHEVAATLACSVAIVRDRLATARLVSDVPGVAAAAIAGALRWWQVRRVVEAVVGLGPDVCAEVDRRMAADAAAGRCRNRFGARLARAVLAADPATADRVHREGVADRRVSLRPSDAGMAWFGACLPAEDALTVARCLDELAAEPDGAVLDAGHLPSTGPAGPAAEQSARRTADQRRADALTAMARAALEALHDCRSGLDGVTDERLRERFTAHLRQDGGLRPASPTSASPSPVGSRVRKGPRRAARRRAEIQLVVSAETVLGIADTPGELAGYGPVGPEQARRIAHLVGTTWRRLIADPVTGVVLDRGRTAYTPPAALADHVRARFGWTCTRPGCSNVAADLDHATAWAELGGTSVDNLHTVCRGCHTAKHAGWTVRIAPDGTTTWRTPHGRSSATRPTDHRPEDRVPRVVDPIAPIAPTAPGAPGAPAVDWWGEVRRVAHSGAEPPVRLPQTPMPAPF